jgi:hypothetical protein
MTATLVRSQKRRIEQYCECDDLGYAPPLFAQRGDDAAFAAFPKRLFRVDELVG